MTSWELDNQIDHQFQHVDAAVRASVLEQCMHEYGEDNALEKAFEILQEISHAAVVDDSLAPTALQQQVWEASQRYPLLPQELLEEICRAYEPPQAEEVLREAHEHLKAELTGATQLQATQRPSSYPAQQEARTPKTQQNEWNSAIPAKTRIIVNQILKQFPQATFDFVLDLLQANRGNTSSTIAQLQQLGLEHDPLVQGVAVGVRPVHGEQVAAMRSKAMELRGQVKVLEASMRQLHQAAGRCVGTRDSSGAHDLQQKAARVRVQRDELLQQAQQLELYTRTHTLEHTITVELHGLDANTAAQRVQEEIATARARGGTTRMHIITGMGNHSQRGAAVLLPLVRQILTDLGIAYTMAPNGGGVVACVKMQPPLHLLQ